MRTRFLFPALLIGLVACSSSPDDAAPTSADAPPADAITISVADFMIDPSEVEASGPTVSFEVTNDGPTPHNLTVREGDEVVLATADLSVGESETVSAELDPGTYTIFCSLAGHESLGMSGTLTVSGS